MKKIFNCTLILTLCIVLTGCGQETQKITKCKLSSNNTASGYLLSSEYEIYSTGNVVDKVITTETVTTEDQEVINYFKTYMTDTYNKRNETYGGTTNNIEVNENTLVSTTTIDYNNVDMEKYVSENTAIKKYTNSKNRITKKGIISMYTSNGAVCE